METTVTLTRLYKKEVTIEIPQEELSGMSEEEIADYLMDEWVHDADKSFESVEYECISEDELPDTDRFDIYENGEQVYGGHL